MSLPHVCTDVTSRCASQDIINRYKTGNVTINVTLRVVRINVVAMEEQKEFHNITLSVCL